MTTDSATDLCYTTASEALALFKARKLSPVELTEAVIARSEAVNPKVNAYTYTFYERALEQARVAEEKYGKIDGRLRALEGIPCAIKDLHPVKGEITTWGSRVYEGVRSEFTAPTVQRLFNAGIIMHARTTTPEFAHTGHCHSPLWGATRNPWNTEFSSGGSSGGAGAAVAAGMTTLADGTDGGGSVRIPSSACGIFGVKPSFGRNPVGILETNLELILHFGPMTRSVEDARLMQNVMCGPWEGDITTLRPKLRIPELDKLGGVEGQEVRLLDRPWLLRDRPGRPEEHQGGGGGLQVARSPGRRDRSRLDDGCVRRLDDPLARDCSRRSPGQYLPRWQYQMDPYVRELLHTGMNHSHVRVKQTEFVRTQMYDRLGKVLKSHDYLICPTLAVPSVDAWHKCDDPDFTIDGEAGRRDAAVVPDLSLQSRQPVPGRHGAHRVRLPAGCRPACRSWGARMTTSASSARPRPTRARIPGAAQSPTSESNRDASCPDHDERLVGLPLSAGRSFVGGNCQPGLHERVALVGRQISVFPRGQAPCARCSCRRPARPSCRRRACGSFPV